jgi:type VI secretion system protein ImpF
MAREDQRPVQQSVLDRLIDADPFNRNEAPPTRSRMRLRQMIERAISMFEPRLASVQVMDSQAESRESRQLRFRIEALLRVDPAPEQVVFSTVLDVATGEYLIRSESGA